MKHYDIDAKKFIKNVVCLVVSAILLVAATVAWFVKASNASLTMGNGTSVMIPMDFSFAHIDLSDSDDFLDYASSAHTVDANHANGNYDLVVRNRSVANNPTSTDIYSYLTDADVTWTTDEYDGAWDLDALYPGEFGVFRIRYVADSSTKALSLNFASAVSSSNFDSNALAAIRVYAVAIGYHTSGQGQAQTTTSSVLASANTNLASVITGSAASEFPVLSNISASAPGDSVTVYYVIGIPAAGDDVLHDALRQTGAAISIQSVTVN